MDLQGREQSQHRRTASCSSTCSPESAARSAGAAEEAGVGAETNLTEATRSISSASSQVSNTEVSGATLSWRDVSAFGTAKARSWVRSGVPWYKRIINNVSGVVQPGVLVAVMGASGAGKSTLMGALAHRSPAGIVVEGDIRVNGHPVGDFMRHLSGFLHQEDIFVAELTVLEHLSFMARLRLDRRMGCAERAQKVQQLLKQLGLSAVQHTRIGTAGDGKVLSGGERKRLAFATELLTDPPLLFCDEPTTGLDSYSAQQLVDLMQDMAARGKTILCTIHQPSSDLLARFHRVILMAEGRIAFIGQPQEALLFFREQGFQCPPSYNPADFFIRTLACTPGDEDASAVVIRRICDRFAVSEYAKEIDVLVSLQHQRQEEAGSSQDLYLNVNSMRAEIKLPLWPQRVWLLTSRSMLQIARNPSIQGLRILQKLVIAVMAGLCFLGTVSDTQAGVVSVQGAIFILVSENTFYPMYSVLEVFPSEIPLFMREYRAGLYGPATFYVSKITSMLPGMVVEPLLFAIVAYLLVGLRCDVYAVLMTIAIVILTMNVSTACGFFFSSAFESVPTAMAYLVPFDYVLMITSGVFVKLSSLPPLVAWTQYMSWLMYSNEAMSILQWDGISNITCANAALPCLSSGEQVLDQYSFNASHLTRNLVAMGLLYAVFHALGLVCLWRRAKGLK